MDRRASPSHPTPPRLPTRADTQRSHASSHATLPRASLHSRLSAIRSASQPTPLVALSVESPPDTNSSNGEAFWHSRELVTSPELITLEDDEAAPPAKRAKTNGADFRSERVDNGDLEEAGTARYIHPSSPLPSLPPAPSLAKTITAHRRQCLGVESAARKPPASLVPPTMATRLPTSRKAAEFSPWTGQQPEDVLSENVIKNGFFDKTQGANQAECHSGKATASATFNQKNSHGLSLLGYLFTTVLEKRQAVGKCSAASTFKPPPRVTVTDAKREAWLRDLANAEVPLRKQSRTIPHGIRGKLLMEQCLAKAVPLPRAVWLAKCVGANELRAFRRKGIGGSAAASGEAKWVREWTTQVEQFLEGVVVSCNQADWQRRMNYAIKLGAAFYSEKLLDKDQFLDWIVSSLTSAAPDRLPIWIVLTQLYWPDIIVHGRRGRRLAEGLLRQLDHTSKQHAASAMRSRLRELVVFLATSSPRCLIIPRSWEKYRNLVGDVLGSDHVVALEHIASRNRVLTQPRAKSADDTGSPTVALFSILDSTNLGVDIAKLTDACLSCVPDTTQLLRALLDWASTMYRVGTSRIYLSAALIAHLHETGSDTDSAILQYLGQFSDSPTTSGDHVHRVIVELVHRQVFSTGRYMQWLITSGIASGGANACATGLIAALPTDDLPLHFVHVRKTIMKRLGYPPEQGSGEVGLSDRLHHSEAYDKILQGWSMSERYSVCREICGRLKSREDAITLDDFCIARCIIEQVGDERSLSTVLKSSLLTHHSILLATICDTVHLHAETFAALDVLDELLDGLGKRYVVLRSAQPLERSLIVALLSLAERLPERASLVQLLRADIALCEQQTSFAICSPASDNVVGMQGSSLDCDDALDAVFASGNHMDQQLMARVFGYIMQRAAKSPAHGAAALQPIAAWLSQLRMADSSGLLDGLVSDYIRTQWWSAAGDDSALAGIVHLISSGILTFDTVAGMAEDTASAGVALKSLPLFISPDAADVVLRDAACYRFRLQQERYRADHVESVLSMVYKACESPSIVTDNSDLLGFVIAVATRQPSSLTRLGFLEATEHSPTLRTKFCDVMIAAQVRGSGLALMSKDIGVVSVVSTATPLSLALCVGALTHLKRLPSWNAAEDGHFRDALRDAFENDSEVWPHLIECAEQGINTQLHDWARDQVLSVATSDHTGESEDGFAYAERCLRLLAVSDRLITRHDDPGTFVMITEKLKEVGSGHEVLSAPSEGNARLWRPVEILLQLVAVSLQSRLGDTDNSEPYRVSLLAALCALIAQPEMDKRQALASDALSLACALADTLSKASLINVQHQSSTSTLSNPHVQSILGSTAEQVEPWLLLASHVPALGSQQQRLLNRNSSQQQHPSGRRIPVETKTMPLQLREWEAISDAAPVMGENDAMLNLKMFGARKV